MGNCCGGSATVPSESSSPSKPVPVHTVPSSHSTFTPSSHVASSSKSISGTPVYDTAHHEYEMTTLSPENSAVAPERLRSQDSTSSQRRRDDRDYPPPPSDSNPHGQEMRSLYRHRGPPSKPQKSRPTATTSPQGPPSHPSSQMTRTPSTFLHGDDRSQPTGTQPESGLASGTGQMPVDRQERRPRFPSTLQTVLSNDFRCVARCRADSPYNCCTIIHRFRILVVGKVCIMCHTSRRRN